MEVMMRMPSLTEKLKQLALEVGFVSIGVTSSALLDDLPYGPVGQITTLRQPIQEMPDVKSVILLTFHIWDKIFNLAVDPPGWRGYGLHTPDEEFESYYLPYEIMKNKAWELVDFLRREGYDARYSMRIPLKTTAIKCGLGCQGKSTLLVTPEHGPRVNLISILTDAELEIDEPFEENLCGDCNLCVTACPTKALASYTITIEKCMTYSAESPCSLDVSPHVREMEKKLVSRPTQNSYIECARCMEVCPIGKKQAKTKSAG
ncbi:MAG: 4Fe-4S double cluster binding domain-containing protein [Candidatus Thorarchaeota archaeon]